MILTTGDFSNKCELHNNKYSADTTSHSAGRNRSPTVKNSEFGVDVNAEEEKEKLVKTAALFPLFFKVLSEKVSEDRRPIQHQQNNQKQLDNTKISPGTPTRCNG